MLTGGKRPRLRRLLRHRRLARLPRLAQRILVILLATCAGLRGADGQDGLSLEGQAFRDRNGVWVNTAVLALSKALAPQLRLGWSQTYDMMSGASRRLGKANTGRLDSARAGGVDAVSHASLRESRHASKASLSLGGKDRNLTGSLYYSREADYASLAPGAGLFRRCNRGNTTVSLDGAWFFDTSRPLAPFRDQGGKREIRTLGVSATQVLTPLLLAAAGASMSLSEGRLEHPYTPTVTRQGVLLEESLPGRRRGASVFGQAIQGYVLRGRLGCFDLRLDRYQDDWGLSSGAADLKWTQNVLDASHIRLRVRGYSQRGAVFARQPYDGDEAYHSADVRLHSFRSLLLGIKLGGGLPDPWQDSPLLPDAWNLGYERTFRDTHGDDPAGERNRTYQLYGPGEIYRQDVARFGLDFGF